MGAPRAHGASCGREQVLDHRAPTVSRRQQLRGDLLRRRTPGTHQLRGLGVCDRALTARDVLVRCRAQQRMRETERSSVGKEVGAAERVGGERD